MKNGKPFIKLWIKKKKLPRKNLKKYKILSLTDEDKYVAFVTISI